MRSFQIWRGVGVAVLAFLVGETIAQDDGPLAGLDELLGNQKNLTTFHSYLKKYPQILAGVKAGEGITIIAPDNEAMDKIPSSILKEPFERNDTDAIVNALQYHVMVGTQRTSDLVDGRFQNRPTLLTDSKYSTVKGGQRVTYVKAWDNVVTFISGLGTRCTLLVPDLPFSNGMVQIIDSPLIPPQSLTLTTTQYNLTAFEGALITSNKLEDISKEKTVTIFAPKNEAFQALGPAISTMTVEQLSKVLSYHVITSDTVYSSSLTNGTVLTTSTGQKLTVFVFGNLLFVNSAQVTEKDILIANGVIHILDTVLDPENTGGEPDPGLATQKPVFDNASSVDSIPFTSAIPCSTACRASATGTGATAGTGAGGVTSTNSRGVAMARETGFSGTIGFAAAVVGGAVMMM